MNKIYLRLEDNYKYILFILKYIYNYPLIVTTF